MPVRRLTATVIVAVIVAVALGAASTAAATPPPTAPPLPSFATALAWDDCGDGFECATLTVPVDWAQPRGDQVGIAMTRHAALEPARRIGALFVNYGGPGQGGIEVLRQLYDRMPYEVRARFDVVTFDPRGTGGSRPVDCVDDAVLDLSSALPAVPTDEATLAAYQRYLASFAQGCTDRMGAYAGQLGTRNVARDLEAMRIALGEPTMNYLGYSYGTIIGEAYAQMYPGHLRAMVLDGPPDSSLSTRELEYQQAKGFADALTAFADWCRASSCPLTAAGDPRAVVDQLVARVATDPIPASYSAGGVTRSGTLGSAALANGVLSLLYEQRHGWPILADALLAAAADGNGGPLLAAADSFVGRNPDGTYAPSTEAFPVISCVDRPAPKRRPTNAQILGEVAAFQRQLPPWGGSWAVPTCIGMPKPAKGDKLGDLTVPGAPPILVVGTTGDPATPYAGAEATVRHIAGSSLLTYEATEHTGYGTGRSGCVDEAVDRYLVDLTMPAPGTRCAPGYD